MDNEQTITFEDVSLLEMYSGEVLTCNKLIALSYDGKTADKLISEIKQRGSILSSEALIMQVYNKDASDNLTIGFSDSGYDSILNFKRSKDYNKGADFIVAKLSDDCDVYVLNFYIKGKMPGLPGHDNNSPWYFIAKKPENSVKYLNPSCYDEVYKTAIESEAEFMWDIITERDSGHYVMYATGMYGDLNAPKILKERQ